MSDRDARIVEQIEAALYEPDPPLSAHPGVWADFWDRKVTAGRQLRDRVSRDGDAAATAVAEKLIRDAAAAALTCRRLARRVDAEGETQ